MNKKLRGVVFVFALFSAVSAFAGGGSRALCALYPELPYCQR